MYKYLCAQKINSVSTFSPPEEQSSGTMWRSLTLHTYGWLSVDQYLKWIKVPCPGNIRSVLRKRLLMCKRSSLTPEASGRTWLMSAAHVPAYASTPLHRFHYSGCYQASIISPETSRSLCEPDLRFSANTSASRDSRVHAYSSYPLTLSSCEESVKVLNPGALNPNDPVWIMWSLWPLPSSTWPDPTSNIYRRTQNSAAFQLSVNTAL